MNLYCIRFNGSWRRGCQLNKTIDESVGKPKLFLAFALSEDNNKLKKQAKKESKNYNIVFLISSPSSGGKVCQYLVWILIGCISRGS